MSRPTSTPPSWATDAQFASGPRINTDTKNAMSAAELAQGLVPGKELEAEKVNDTLNKWAENLRWLKDEILNLLDGTATNGNTELRDQQKVALRGTLNPWATVHPSSGGVLSGLGQLTNAVLTEANQNGGSLGDDGFSLLYTTGAVLNDDAGWYSNTFTRRANLPIATMIFRANAISDERKFIGLTNAANFNQQVGSSNPSESYVGLEVDTSLGESSFYVTADNGSGSPTKFDTAVFAAGGTFAFTIDLSTAGEARLTIRDLATGAKVFPTSAEYYTINTTLPGTTTNLRAMFAQRNLAASARTTYFYGFNMRYFGNSVV